MPSFRNSTDLRTIVARLDRLTEQMPPKWGFAVDRLACFTCHGVMRLVACITPRSVIDRILAHRRARAGSSIAPYVRPILVRPRLKFLGQRRREVGGRVSAC